MRFILGSTSPARLALLRAAGLDPEPVAPGVDEETLQASLLHERGALSAEDLVAALAAAKAHAVAARFTPVSQSTLVFGGDSAFDWAGHILGKPHTAARARERWLAHNGGSGTLWSGHTLIRLEPGQPPRVASKAASAQVHFATLSTDEIDAYVASGEPLNVAGAFTIDSLGGPFIRSISGDPSTVVGLSLSTLRVLAAELGVNWPTLWRVASA